MIDTGLQSMHMDSMPPLVVVDDGGMPSSNVLVDNQHTVQLHQHNHDGMECDDGRGNGEGVSHAAGNEENSGEHWESESCASESEDEVSSAVWWGELTLAL